MLTEAHTKAAGSYKEASKQHEEAAKHCAAGNHKDAASCAVQADSHSCQGDKHAEDASHEYTKKQAKK